MCSTRREGWWRVTLSTTAKGVYACSWTDRGGGGGGAGGRGDNEGAGIGSGEVEAAGEAVLRAGEESPDAVAQAPRSASASKIETIVGLRFLTPAPFKT